MAVVPMFNGQIIHEIKGVNLSFRKNEVSLSADRANQIMTLDCCSKGRLPIATYNSIRVMTEQTSRMIIQNLTKCWSSINHLTSVVGTTQFKIICNGRHTACCYKTEISVIKNWRINSSSSIRHLQPFMSLIRLILEVPRSHTMTHHSR